MELSEAAQVWVNLLLLWLGFGVLVALIAQAFLPSGEPKNLYGVLVVGVMGSCVGPLAFSLIFQPERFNPIGPMGLFVSVVATLIFLLIYRFFLSLTKKRPNGG